ncbi:HlyD family secretion protein [Achromobacter aloeverae]|uniref:Multidrug ABC transporter permease n=1 Tax=Achromobacter aloeverae TaxID=1750518 RepID=A0A4Q1HIB9_9BURK|nr:HlyD family secretion protein [Achromobacter aloeverae]RXN87948.1 multidrug ABC transporter permease [Achromobacter aloeverae]
MSTTTDTLPGAPPLAPPLAPPPPAASRPRPASRRRLALLAGAGLAVLAGAAWLGHWWLVGRYFESTDDAYLQADAMTVAPKISGYVAEVYVADNQTVKVGDPLLRLDDGTYRATLDQAKATIAAREADLARAQAALRQQQASLEQAQAQQRVARLNAQHAEDEVRRYRPLAASGAETSERLANLVNTRDQAQATLAANTAAVAAAQAQLAVTAAEIDQARAQADAARASARQAALDLQDTVVRASQPGRIGDRSVRVGQYVQPGTRAMTVVPVQNVYLVANFKETQIGRMRVNQPVTLHVDALPGTDLHGVVDSFAPGTGSQFALLPPENATGNFTKIVQRVPVRIRIDTGPATRSLLLPGLSVTAEVDTRGARDDEQKVREENRATAPAASNHG